jgi:hypothetical protein
MQIITTYANELYKLGLFIGVGNDEDDNPVFELDESLNRIDALVLIIRLLGREEAALSFDGINPFTDTPDWASKYLAYAYDQGITLGVSATQFAPDLNVTLQEFTTFILRVLGYHE